MELKPEGRRASREIERFAGGLATNPRPRLIGALAAVVALTALTVLSLWSVSTPSPKGADAPADEFSAARAFAHVERIAGQVHVAGSTASDDVRDYIDSTLTGYGLQTQTQEAVGGTSNLGGTFGAARVRNLIAVLPGTAPTGRLFLVAHYDSVQVSYGANDDGAGVSTLLETARILAAGPAPRNDVVFVFTDAEEACLCGAEAFVSQHPLAADGGVVLNFEARGTGGPVVMFETSLGNANLVGVYGDAVPHKVATSFAVEVYRILPNDTDFTPFREAGRFTGLNSAYIDGSAAYHSPQDRPSYLDKGSLQMHGDNALALVRALGSDDLAQLSTPSANDSTYFPFLGFLVRYPGWLVWPIAVVALLAVAGLAILARRRELLSWPRLAAGFGLSFIPLLVAAIGAQLVWLLLTLIRPSYAVMLEPWRPGWFRLGVVAFVAAALLTWFGLLRRRIGSWPLIVGGLGLLSVLGLVLAAATPGGSYLAALPALCVAVGSALGLWLGSWIRYVAPALAVALAIPLLAPTVLLFFPALGLATGAAAAVFAVLLGLAALPVLDWLYPAGAARRRLWSAAPATVAGVLTIACLVTGLAVDTFDRDHPKPTQLMYALDTDTNKAYWLSEEANPTAWTNQYLTGRQDLSETFPVLNSGELSTGPADAASLPAPDLTVESDVATAGQRHLTVRLTPQRVVRLVFLGLQNNVTVVSATVEGRELPVSDLSDGKRFGILFHAPAADGVVVELVLDQTGPVDLRAMDGSDGLAALPGFRPRPDDVGVDGGHESELVLVAKSYHL